MGQSSNPVCLTAPCTLACLLFLTPCFKRSIGLACFLLRHARSLHPLRPSLPLYRRNCCPGSACSLALMCAAFSTVVALLLSFDSYNLLSLNILFARYTFKRCEPVHIIVFRISKTQQPGPFIRTTAIDYIHGQQPVPSYLKFTPPKEYAIGYLNDSKLQVSYENEILPYKRDIGAAGPDSDGAVANMDPVTLNGPSERGGADAVSTAAPGGRTDRAGARGTQPCSDSRVG